MLRIIDQKCLFVSEYGLSFLEGDAMLPSILRFFPGVPLESELKHTYIVIMT